MQDSNIIFVCEHGAAKSIIAAAYFNLLAEQANLEIRAIARGTNPDSELSPKTIAGLHADGLTPTETIPQKLSPADVAGAQQIVTFSELPEDHQNKIAIERWDDVPAVSENYEKARDTIVERLNHLLDSLRSST
jgi:protein-tyrosine-phosphatase